MVNVFAVPVFFIVFRETIEAAIIVAILLSFLKQTFAGEGNRKIYKRLRWHIWLGVLTSFIIVLAIGGGMIGAFYKLGQDAWSKAELLWEGIFSLIAAVIITIMGMAVLRISKMKEKWSAKITAALESQQYSTPGQRAEKYSLFILPFITILREGLEAVIFVGGVGLSFPASAFPLPVSTGLMGGILIGWIMYRGGSLMHIQIFLIISTCFLYLVAAGLFSRGVWDIEMYKFGKIVGGDVAETGSGPGSYDIRQSVWHVNCCSPQLNGGGGWGIFNALFGWTNSATYGSVIAYNLYWLTVIAIFIYMYHREKKQERAEGASGVIAHRNSPGHSDDEVTAAHEKAAQHQDVRQTEERV